MVLVPEEPIHRTFIRSVDEHLLHLSRYDARVDAGLHFRNGMGANVFPLLPLQHLSIWSKQCGYEFKSKMIPSESIQKYLANHFSRVLRTQ